MRRALVASAILATLLTAPLSLASAPPTSASEPTDSERATAALRYLWAAQLPDGSIDDSIGETADFVIGTAAAGYDPVTLEGCAGTATALGFLATASDAAAGDAAKTGKTVLAVVAAGGDPAAFAGRDLLGRLAALYHSDTGAYGDGSTFGQALAILGLVAAGATVPADATDDLASLQGTDGGWTYDSSQEAAGDGDSNDTAIALMALDAAGGHTTEAAAGLAYLHTQQFTDGGFLFSSAYGPPSDPDSDSIVLQALVAAGQDPESAAWSQGSDNVLTHLRAGQGTDGGFVYPGMGESALTTSQVPAALMRVPYAGAVHWTAGLSLPAIDCAASSPSASLSPSTSPTTIATAGPTQAPTPTPRPTVRPTPRPTVRPTPKPTPKPTSSPTQNPTPPAGAAGPAGVVSPMPAIATSTVEPLAAQSTPADVSMAEVAGVTAEPAASATGSSDSSGPPALLYGVAALFALVAVVGGGWVFLLRPGRR
jgi:hypothetical protein